MYGRPKLAQSKRGVDRFGLRIDKQPDDGHECGQRCDDRARLIERDPARRPGPEHEADCVGARARGGDAVLDARDAADLDARTRCASIQHRGMDSGTTVGGRFQCCG